MLRAYACKAGIIMLLITVRGFVACPHMAAGADEFMLVVASDAMSIVMRQHDASQHREMQATLSHVKTCMPAKLSIESHH